MFPYACMGDLCLNNLPWIWIICAIINIFEHWISFGFNNSARKTHIVQIPFSIFIPPNMENDHSSSETGLIENHPFYKCIKPVIVLQKVAGDGHIDHSRIGESERHCISCLLPVLGTNHNWSIRKISIFLHIRCFSTHKKHVYLPAGSSAGEHKVTQITSLFKYSETLPFWDGLLSRCPREFCGTRRKPKAIKWMMVILLEGNLFPSYVLCTYFALGSDPEPVVMWFAEPWSDSQLASVILLVTMFSTLPAFMSWLSATMMFIVAVYYLCRGFKRLHRTMGLLPDT